MWASRKEHAMTDRAEGTFKVTAWDENSYEELDGKQKLTKASMKFGYTGGLEAAGRSETVMFYREDGTGSGELRGIRGTGKAVAASGQPGGTFTLDYALG